MKSSNQECINVNDFEVTVVYDVIAVPRRRRCSKCHRPINTAKTEKIEVIEMIDPETSQSLPLKSKVAQKAIRVAQRDFPSHIPNLIKSRGIDNRFLSAS